MNNILVALDFNDNEQLLISKVEELANLSNAKVWFMHIAAPEPDFVGYEVGPHYVRDYRAEELREEHKQLQVMSDQLKGKGIDADGLLIQGATVEMIMAEAERLNVNMIALGHHDHNFLHKAFFGSVASDVINQSKIPVLVVPLD